MNQKLQTKNVENTNLASPRILKSILEEIRLLRSEIMFLLSQDNLGEYDHPDRIRESYKKAVKKYPPLSL